MSSAFYEGKRHNLNLDSTGALIVTSIQPQLTATSFGQLGITTNTTPISFTGPTDWKVLNVYDPLPHGFNNAIEQLVGGKLRVTRRGVYRADFWYTASGTPTNAEIMYRGEVNGVATTGRMVRNSIPGSGDYVSSCSYALFELQAGDELAIQMSASVASTVTVVDGLLLLTEIQTLPEDV